MRWAAIISVLAKHPEKASRARRWRCLGASVPGGVPVFEAASALNWAVPTSFRHRYGLITEDDDAFTPRIVHWLFATRRHGSPGWYERAAAGTGIS